MNWFASVHLFYGAYKYKVDRNIGFLNALKYRLTGTNKRSVDDLIHIKGGKMNDDVQTSTVEEVKDTTKNTKDEGVKETDNKVEEKKYTDKELNDISLKNEQKALAKQLKELGIDDVEKAKYILAKAREDEEKSKSVDEKTQEAIKKAEKATLEAINTKIENALLRKNVKDEKITRAVRLVDKKNILSEDGTLDESKLNTEIEDLLKDFPELISKSEENKKGFKIGDDGKEEQKDELADMRKIMGLK